ncbi:MAG: GLPGLI family protein [Pedobacter sp.]|nr:GLPGLI family protein [Pedobacter sp.]
MKISLGFLVVCCTALTTLAQQPDKLLIRVRYTQIKKTDTIINGKARHENMLLFVGKNASLFTSYDKIIHEVAEDQKFRAMIMNRATTSSRPMAFTIDNTPTNWMTKNSYYYFAKENKLFVKEVMALQGYLMEEIAPPIKWKLTKDTASFSGIKCMKATATVADQKWIAWFAPDLPFQAGPWKLNSLPGLIIEAYDEDKNLYFQFAGIENAKEGDIERTFDVTKQPNASKDTFNPVDQLIGRDVASAYYQSTIKLPADAIKTDKEKFEKLREAFLKDPKGFTRSQGRY